MAKNESVKGRNLALTIIVGIFIAIMVITLVNLIISFAYPGPDYNRYCNNSQYYPKPYITEPTGTNCTFNKPLDDQAQNCSMSRGNPIYEYNDNGCAISLKQCDMCQVKLEDDTKTYNRNVFFVFAAIGFILIVSGLFASTLLLQIIALPAGAILVIEAAVRNFSDKLAVIIVLALLVAAAIYLALKKLR